MSLKLQENREKKSKKSKKSEKSEKETVEGARRKDRKRLIRHEKSDELLCISPRNSRVEKKKENSRLNLNKEIRGPKKIKKIIEYFENFQKTKPEGANSTTTKKPKIEGKPLSEEI